MDTTRGHIHEPTTGKQAVRIDRKSAYGNQFKINEPHPDTGLPMTRDDVCELFEARQLPTMDVTKLRGKHLLCWCKDDERCHGDSIIRKLNEEPVADCERMDTTDTDDQLRMVAGRIAQEHAEIQTLMRKAEDRAKIIGQHLTDLMPVLKAQGMSLSEYCRDFLPFGKTTAYDYIKIAKGEITWVALLDRKNSAGAESVARDLAYGDVVDEVIEPNISLLASSLVGFATNVTVYEQLNGQPASLEDFTTALMTEIREMGAEHMSEGEVYFYLENTLRPALQLAAKAAMYEMRRMEQLETNLPALAA